LEQCEKPLSLRPNQSDFMIYFFDFPSSGGKGKWILNQLYSRKSVVIVIQNMMIARSLTLNSFVDLALWRSSVGRSSRPPRCRSLRWLRRCCSACAHQRAIGVGLSRWRGQRPASRAASCWRPLGAEWRSGVVVCVAGRGYRWWALQHGARRPGARSGRPGL